MLIDLKWEDKRKSSDPVGAVNLLHGPGKVQDSLDDQTLHEDYYPQSSTSAEIISAFHSKQSQSSTLRFRYRERQVKQCNLVVVGTE